MDNNNGQRGRIDMRAPQEWINAVTQVANREGQTFSGLVRVAVNAYLRSLGIEPPPAFPSRPSKSEKPKRPRGRPKKQ